MMRNFACMSLHSRSLCDPSRCKSHAHHPCSKKATPPLLQKCLHGRAQSLRSQVVESIRCIFLEPPGFATASFAVAAGSRSASSRSMFPCRRRCPLSTIRCLLSRVHHFSIGHFSEAVAVLGQMKQEQSGCWLMNSCDARRSGFRSQARSDDEAYCDKIRRGGATQPAVERRKYASRRSVRQDPSIDWSSMSRHWHWGRRHRGIDACESPPHQRDPRAKPPW